MSTKNAETTALEPHAEPRTLHPLVTLVTGSKLAVALVTSIAAVVCVAAAGVLMDWETDSLKRYLACAVAAPFALAALSGLLRLLVPFLEPLAEILTRRDWNHSGAVGDYGEPLDVDLDTFFAHLDEMREQLENGIRGSERKAWLEPPYPWRDGTYCSRPEYERLIERLKQLDVLKGRAKGHAGKVV